jgi:hypothetical protein
MVITRSWSVFYEIPTKKPMAILGCLGMSTYRCLALWPEHDGELAAFIHQRVMMHV